MIRKINQIHEQLLDRISKSKERRQEVWWQKRPRAHLIIELLEQRYLNKHRLIILIYCAIALKEVPLNPGSKLELD